jgi:hypothetical protein
MRLGDGIALVLVGLAVSACSKGCGEDLPDPDICSGPRAGSIDSAAVGKGGQPVFAPLQNGDVMRFVFTESGEATLPLLFRLSGSDVPSCVEHRSRLLPADGGDPYVELLAPLHTYPLDEGVGSETKVLYLRLDRDNEPTGGARLRLETEIAGIDLSVELWLEIAGPDAGP